MTQCPHEDWMPVPIWIFRLAQKEPVLSCLRKVQITDAALQCVAFSPCRVQVGVWRMSSGWLDLISIRTWGPPCPGSTKPMLWMYPVWLLPALLIHTHTSDDSFLTWCTCSINLTLVVVTSKWLDPFHVGGGGIITSLTRTDQCEYATGPAEWVTPTNGRPQNGGQL